VAPLGAPGNPLGQASFQGSASSAHKVFVSVLVIIGVAVVMTEVAGINKHWAVVMGLLLVGVILQQGLTHAHSFESWSAGMPYNPRAVA
jgi:hypothetical protein